MLRLSVSRSYRILIFAAALLAPGLRPVLAQDPFQLPAPPPPWGDLGSDIDPSQNVEDPMFEIPLDPYAGSPMFLEAEGSAGLDVAPPDATEAPVAAVEQPPDWAPLDCRNYDGLPLSFKFQPLRLASANPRFFSFHGQPQILVGASADAGCVLGLPAGDVTTQCNITNYPAVFEESENRPSLTATPTIPLNKIRVWVGMGFGYLAPNTQLDVPFLWQTTANGSYWLLDSTEALTAPNAYFNRLRNVINEARKHKLFVEVTFFAPFEGSNFYVGPWSRTQSRGFDPPNSSTLVPMGFTNQYFQVLKDTFSADKVQNEKMRAYQNKVIKWTIDTLWCFDNVYWEIANEPEGLGKTIVSTDVQAAVNPAAAAAWQKSMICNVRNAERTHSLGLGYGHLIAVQPFTTQGATALLSPTGYPAGCPSDSSFPLEVQVLNGHYTTVASSVPEYPSGSHELTAGALDFVRKSYTNKKNIPYGFNETAITNQSGPRGTKHHLNGQPIPGDSPSARAEAWEFLFTGGATYDHYGYLNAATPYQKRVREELGRLLNFYGTKKFNLSPAPALTQFAPAVMGPWFSVTGYGAWETRTHSQRYWAALETQAPVKAVLVYLHHSTPRCKPDTTTYENGCGTAQKLPFNSYDARLWTVAPGGAGPAGYKDTFILNSGTYRVTWIDPATTTILANYPDTTVTCTSANPSSCQITSPVYSFDILLRVVRQ